MKYNLGDKLTINGVVFTVMDEGNQEDAKPTLDQIVWRGRNKMAKAVEAVIANHEGEIKKIADEKIKIKNILDENQRDWRIQASAMEALMGNDNQRRINMLMMAENRARGVAGVGFGNPVGLQGLQGIGASQLSADGWH